MSIHVMSEVWELDLPQHLKFPLLALADHCNDDGCCYPSVARIAWKCGHTVRHIYRILGELRHLGIIRVLSPATAKTPNVYQVVPAAASRLPKFTRTSDFTSDVGVPTPDTGVTPPLTPASSESLREPSTRKSKREGRAISLPLSLEYSGALSEFAAQMGVDGETEFPKFCDWHTSKGSRFVDWYAAWRTWVRRAATSFAPTAAARPRRYLSAPERVRRANPEAFNDFIEGCVTQIGAAP